jgi:hypothetical protein
MTSTIPAVMDPTSWTGMSSCAAERLPATPTDGGWGWAVLQQRGVAAWLRVRQASVATVWLPTPARAGSPIAGNADAELVGLLASMALAVATRG